MNVISNIWFMKTLKTFWENITSDCLICAFKGHTFWGQLSVLPYVSKCHHENGQVVWAELKTSRIRCILALLLTVFCFWQMYVLGSTAINAKTTYGFWFNILEANIYFFESTFIILFNVFPENRAMQFNQLAQLLVERRLYGFETFITKKMARISFAFVFLFWFQLIFVLASLLWIMNANLLTVLSFDVISYFSFTVFFFYSHIVLCNLFIFIKCFAKIRYCLLQKLQVDKIDSPLLALYENDLKKKQEFVRPEELVHNLKIMTRFYLKLCHSHCHVYVFGVVPLMGLFLMVTIYVVNIYVLLVASDEVFANYTNLISFLKHSCFAVGMYGMFYVMEGGQKVVS